MRLSRSSEPRSKKAPRNRRPHAYAEFAEAPAPKPVVIQPEQQRHRRSGGPVDEATYSCACGMVFEARVSTSVSCPHCGAGQAW